VQRDEYGRLIAARLAATRADLRAQFTVPDRIASFVLDDVLPAKLAREVFDTFPPRSDLVLHRSLRERKYIGVQMDRYHSICGEIIYGFQDPTVLTEISAITGIPDLEPDEHLYAGGLSQMEYGHFLNPHLDNSHDKDRTRYRVLNLLYYVTPDWPDNAGGNLELWDEGLKAEPRVLHSAFNRLVAMMTNRTSWHSVQPITIDGKRCCVSNYYFSKEPLEARDYFHITSFRGRPEQALRDIVLLGDGVVRQGLRKVFKKGIRENPHVYRKPEPR